ncbi:MAG: 2-succinyl-5-enolpyruvyl-6-hydroxy-3-cyclohexene-1-carboxylic-acid synthase [Proteobacteria bacterium]|nr:2-succinyl-5-enolpyruvyl-6-hydroxy-3-cyclohexene-1-carboxylic-acid synthase [Pseudomonadota bacterium]
MSLQTIWAELLVATLADAGVATCVISPGSRSTPITCALVASARVDLVTIIDERAAAFYALGVARATGVPCALVCTSGTAAAHYLPALIEASAAGVPLVAITADRPPELLACGASQTIDQIGLYGAFVRGAFDLGAPVGSELALRALRRKVVQAVTLARGPAPGPVHLEVPLRKPLEPAAGEPTLAAYARALVGPVSAAPPTLLADRALVASFVAAIERVREGVIVASATTTPRPELVALARAAGYPILAESGSGLRVGDAIGHLDLIPPARRPTPRLVIQLGSEPVAPSAWGAAERWVLADGAWQDPDSSATGVIVGALGDVELARAANPEWIAAWRVAEAAAIAAREGAIAAVPDGEHAVIRDALAALPADALVQIGNSLPIRVLDHLPLHDRRVLTQRGAAGIDGMIASATGATQACRPVLLILGDVSFAHDVGALLVARGARTPLAILVIDNGGGQIFAGLPIADAIDRATLETQFLTPPDLDPVAIATAFGIRTRPLSSIGEALRAPGPTVIHARVAPDGARRVRARSRTGEQT